MPTYDYACRTCYSVQEEFRTVVERSDPVECKLCGSNMVQAVSKPNIQTLTSDERWVREHEVNGNNVRSSV